MTARTTQLVPDSVGARFFPDPRIAAAGVGGSVGRRAGSRTTGSISRLKAGAKPNRERSSPMREAAASRPRDTGLAAATHASCLSREKIERTVTSLPIRSSPIVAWISRLKPEPPG